MRHATFGSGRGWYLVLALLLSGLVQHSAAHALTLSVKDAATGAGIGTGFRWAVEVDNTHPVTPGLSDPFSVSVDIVKSHAYVIDAGESPSDSTTITLADPSARYAISVLPFSGFTIGSVNVSGAATTATVLVNAYPIPLAQMRVFVFEDTRAISQAPELPAERGLAGWHIRVDEMAGHQAFDGFGNRLGTTYVKECSIAATACSTAADCPATETCEFQFDGTGAPIVDTIGEGITTDENGLAIIKNLQPGDFKVYATPPDGGDWIQTTSEKGTPGFPVTVMAGEPDLFVQGGILNAHAFFGFLQPFRTLAMGTGTITGRCVQQHGSHPPLALAFPGPPLPNCMVGLNAVEAGVEVGVLAQRANPDGTFSINSVPAGTWQLVTWDRELLHLMTIRTVDVGPGETVNLGDVTLARWLGTIQGFVFNDENENGIMDPGEEGIPAQGTDIRHPAGNVVAAGETDTTGFYSFPAEDALGSWDILEVNFDNFKATGATFAADLGGPVGPNGVSNPETPRTETGLILLEGFMLHPGQVGIADWGKKEYGPGPDGMYDTPDDESGGIVGIAILNTTRAEDDPRLAAAEEWEPGLPNVQIMLYRDADGDEVVDDIDGLSDPADLDGNGMPSHVTLADVDNWPLGWADGSGTKGPEDVDWNYPGQTAGDFDAGDAIHMVWTDSFDDNLPTDCIGVCSVAQTQCKVDGDCPATETCSTSQTVDARICSVTDKTCASTADCPATETCLPTATVPIHPCAETLQTWNQFQPELFDGGYALDQQCEAHCSGSGDLCDVDGDCPATQTCKPGWSSICNTEPISVGRSYIVQIGLPPGVEIYKEEDRNVDFGDEYTPTPAVLPPKCVGKAETVPPFMSLPKVDPPPAPFAGEPRRLCDMKSVHLGSGQNVNCDFPVFTFVPKTGRLVLEMLNLNAAQLDPANPNFGGFFHPRWLPISIKDYLDIEHYRVTGDEYGKAEVLVASTYTANPPEPSGIAPGVWKVCPNDPGPACSGSRAGCKVDADCPATETCGTDPFYDPRFDQPCYRVSSMPGLTTRVPVPVNAISAVSAATTPFDCELPDGTPEIHSVTSTGANPGPYLDCGGVSETLTITAVGSPPGSPVSVPDWTTPGGTVLRDFSFGAPGDVALGGLSLTPFITSWTPGSITVTVPPAPNPICTALASGPKQLLITRASGKSSWVGITVHSPATSPLVVVAGGPLQPAITAAAPGTLVLVPPGTYQENLIITKPLILQGFGANSTVIDAGNFTANKAAWQATLEGHIDAGDIELIPGQRDDFSQDSGAGITIASKTGAFTSGSSVLIDGLKIKGAADAGGIFLSGHAPYVQVSNNKLEKNQGFYGGGLRSGWINLINDTLTGYHSSDNHHLTIHHNHFNQNGSLIDGGGAGLYTGTDGYTLTDNFMCGNYSGFNGAAVSIFGLSDNGLIANNAMVFNEAFGEGGAIALVGEFVPNGAPAGFQTEATGNQLIDSNLIQGNLAGDDGGGISVFSTSGQDVAENPADMSQWYAVDIINNKVVNNISVFAGAGIALADAVNVRIVHNTIANNDSTSLAAMEGGEVNASTAQGAGIVARPNSPMLAAASGEPFANPVLDNNTIWHNRTFYWDGEANGGLGELKPDPVSPYWDLQVFGMGTGVGLDPRYCILTDTTDPRQPITYDGSNKSMDPAFVDEYFNDITVGPNIIAPVYAPRSLSNGLTASLGPDFPHSPYCTTGTCDYHITMGSPAVDMGSNASLGMFGPELQTDCDGDTRPDGGAVDIGADEVHQTPGTCNVSPTPCGLDGDCPATQTCTGLPADTVGPVTAGLSAIPNPTMGAGTVDISATAYDTFTGGSTIMAAEWWIGTDPGAGMAATMTGCTSCGPMLPSDGTFNADSEGIEETVALPGGNHNIFVRSKDSAGNWGVATTVFVTETGASAGDTLPPLTANLTAAPNPTNGASMVEITAVAYDTFTGGSNICEAEWFIGAPPPLGDGNPMAATDSSFDSVEENIRAMVPVEPTDFTITVRSKDCSGNWETSATVDVTVTPADAGSGRGVFVQCPGDADGDAVIDAANDPHRRSCSGSGARCASDSECPATETCDGDAGPYSYPSNVRCKHITGGDGFVTMADGRPQYMFGFADVTGTAPDRVVSTNTLKATFPSALISVDEDDAFYLNMTNVSMLLRPDLFDPHSIHWHGFPNASAIFDGVPDASVAVGMGSTLTYYYNVKLPGTYMYHCHVEATEHMQMGMLGNLYVRPKQNRFPDNYCFATAAVEAPGSCAGHQHSNPDWNANRNLDDPLIGDTYVYNDGDGSTYYDVEYPVQIGSFDPEFHDASENVQPLPFALMRDTYAMLNGRGYPDTMSPTAIVNSEGHAAQEDHTKIDATQGQIVLLRISNLNVTNFYTLSSPGIPMKVVGADARLLRGPTGKDLSYWTNSVTLGGGQSVDVLLYTAGITAGTYPLHTTNLHYLNNNEEQFGGMMTEITIVAP